MILLTLQGFEFTWSSSWQTAGHVDSTFGQSIRAVYPRVGLHPPRWSCTASGHQHCKSSYSDS